MRHPTIVRSWPGGLLGMLALVAAIESFVARNWLDFSDPVSLNWRVSAADVRRHARGQDVLLLGDSLVKHGVIPRVIEERSGLRAWNLAVARGPAPTTYFLFRRALGAGARPSSVVVDFKPSVLRGDPPYNLRYWEEFVTAREGLELIRETGRMGFAASLIVGRLLPSFRCRLEVRSNLAAALRGETDRVAVLNRVLRQHWERNGGANVASRNPAYDGGWTPVEGRSYRADLWRPHRVNLRYLRRLFDLAAARGIKVYWLLPPVAPRLQTWHDGAPAESGYLRLVEEIRRGHPEVTILDARHADYPHTVFVDPTHLDRQGALALSVAVADVLRRDRTGTPAVGRWVNLPQYHEHAPEHFLEDVEQTRLATSKAGERPSR